MFDTELESFKSSIDLRAYAVSQGYQLDRKKSWRGSAVMRHPTGDKIVIKRDAASGHYVYFSIRDDRDNGTIIDFVQNRHPLSIGAIRNELRFWIGQTPFLVPTFKPLVKTVKNRMLVEMEYAKMQDASSHPYLESERALPAAVLASERFAGRIRLEFVESVRLPNAVFPHFDGQGLCGYEIKNHGFTGFLGRDERLVAQSYEAG